MDISDWREEIDELDLKLLKLLNRRAECALRIGKIKKAEGSAVYRPEREAWIIKRLIDQNGGPLGAGGIQRIFERIIDESRTLERDVNEKSK